MTDRTTVGEWSAFHVYLPHSQQTRFLCQVVGPLMRDVGEPCRFFFLRYWQGGPHVRLRIAGATETILDRVRTSLVTAVPALTRELSDEYAREVSNQAELADLEGEQPAEIRPPGTVEPRDYVPEYGKYGGPAGIEIAERVFCETSVAVLDLLSARADEVPTAPMGECMRITAMSLAGSGLGVEDSHEFLGRYEAWWRRYVPPGYDKTWSALYDRTRVQVRNLCASVWRDGQTDTFHDIYANALASARSAGGASPDDDLARLLLADTTYAGCLANYVHTTNNRLGMIPAGEAFVAHVLRRSLADLESS